MTNPFRVLGLHADADRRAVLAGAARVRLRAKVGAPFQGFDPLAVSQGDVARTEPAVQTALGQLADPATRLEARVLWFPAGDNAAWYAAAAGWHGSVVLGEATPADVRMWAGILAKGALWQEILAGDAASGYRPAAQVETAAAVREKLTLCFLKMVADRLAALYTEVDTDRAADLVAALRDSGFPPDVVYRCEARALSPQIERLRIAVARLPGRTDPKGALEDDVWPQWNRLAGVAGADAVVLKAIREDLAAALCDLAARCLDEGKSAVARAALERAEPVAQHTRAMSRLSELRRRSEVIESEPARSLDFAPEPIAKFFRWRLHAALATGVLVVAIGFLGSPRRSVMAPSARTEEQRTAARRSPYRAAGYHDVERGYVYREQTARYEEHLRWLEDGDLDIDEVEELIASGDLDPDDAEDFGYEIERSE